MQKMKKWNDILKPAPHECNFCSSTFWTTQALASHKRHRHKLQTHCSDTQKLQDAFKSVPASSSTRLTSIVAKTATKPRKRKRYSMKQKSKILEAYNSTANGKKRQWLRENHIPLGTMGGMLKHKQRISQAAKKRKTSQLRTLPPKDRSEFPDQRKKLYEEVRARREEGKVVDCEFLQTRFLQILKEDKPSGWEKAKASPQWRTGFLKKHNLSSQRKTNKKSKSVEERLPQIKRFHEYVVFGLPYVLPPGYKYVPNK